jgi:EmrB/QacA subfamily drug resistance transporter
VNLSGRRVWPVVVAVQLGVLLAALESTVVGTATPTLIAALGGAALYPWVFAAYMLASTVVMPIFGSLSDRIGRKGPYLFAVATFCAGSLVAGAAGSMPVLILGRLLQGAGAGGLLSLSLIIFGDLFAGRRRGRMQGLITAMWGVASLIGPVLGGTIVDRWNWRWVFLLNLPLGLVVIALVAWGVRESVPVGRSERLDIPGAAVFVVGATALLLAVLTPGGDTGGGGLGRWVATLVALLALVAFVRVEGQAADPLLPLSLFRERVFVAAGVVSFLTSAAMFGALVHVPLLVQWGQGTDATTAGLSLTTMSTGWSIGALVAGQFMNRTGFQGLVVGGAALLTAAYVGLALAAGAPWPVLMWIGGGAGLGMGMTSITLVVAVQTLVSRAQRGTATAGILFFRNVGATLGVAAMGAVLTTRLGGGLTHLGAEAGPVPAELARSLVTEVGRVLWLGAGMAGLALGATFFLPAGSPVAQPASGPSTGARRGESVEEMIG